LIRIFVELITPEEEHWSSITSEEEHLVFNHSRRRPFGV